MRDLMSMLALGLVRLTPEGGGGGGNPPPAPPAPPAPPVNPPPSPPVPPVPGDEAKTLLAQRERELSETRQRLASLEKSLLDVKDLPAALESARTELNEFHLKEARRNAVNEVVKKVTADGKFEVDAPVLEKYAERLSDKDKLEADILSFAETAKREKRGGGAPQRSTTGQPPAEGGDDGQKSLTDLYRQDPEAYKRALAERVKGKRFFGGG